MASAQVLEPVGRVMDGIQALPWTMHVVVGAAFIAGVALWLAGRRFIRPATVLVGCAFGSAIGFVMLPVLMPTSGLSPYLGLAVGLVAGLLAGMLLYKLATAMTFGSMLGAGCALLAAAIVTAPFAAPPAAAAMDDGPGRLGGEEGLRPLRPVLDPEDERPGRVNPSPTDLERPVVRPNPKPNLKPIKGEAPKTVAKTDVRARPTSGRDSGANTAKTQAEQTNRPSKAANNRTEPARASTPAKTVAAERSTPTIREPLADLDDSNPTSERAREFWGALKSESSEAWGSLPSGGKVWIAGAALTGLALGTILGLMLPAWAAGATTSLVGSAIWLPCGVWLAHATGVPGHAHLNLSPIGWAMVWVVAALIGIAAQWRGLIDTDEPATAGKKKGGGKKKSKKPPQDEDEE
ncbi:MAG: hypothetical protein ACREJO_00760 [Phycisphaerales bacterium]